MANQTDYENSKEKLRQKRTQKKKPSPEFFLGQGGMWDSNPRVPDPQTGVLTKLHQYRHNDSTENNITYWFSNTIKIKKTL